MSFSALHVFCADCNREVQMLTSRQAAEVLETSRQQLEELVGAGKVHAVRTVSGGSLICNESLIAKNPAIDVKGEFP